MAIVKHFRVTVMPTTAEPDSLYYVGSGADAVPYLTDSSRNVKNVFNRAEVQAMIDAAVALAGSGHLVADIAERDSYAASLQAGVTKMIVVEDASGDSTVDAGSAQYFWTGTEHVKVSEFESLDVVRDWAGIVDGPTSLVADIDDAVGKRHTHGNLGVLNLLSVIDGSLAYDGAPLRAQWEEPLEF